MFIWLACAARAGADAQQYAHSQMTLAQVSASAQGWVNHVRYANSTGLRKHILGQIIKI